MSYISLTNYDVDGAVSYIMLNKRYKFEKVFACGYGKLDANIQKAIDYAEARGITGICISDWSLTLEQYKKIESHFATILHIDHHETSQEVYDYIERDLDVVLCAAVQCAKHVVNLGYKLTTADKKLLSACNAYDNWKTEHKDFFLGRQLTEIFYYINLWNFVDQFEYGFTGFTETESEWLDGIFTNKQRIMDESVVEEVNSKKVVVIPQENGIINDTTLMLTDYESYFIFYQDHTYGNIILSVRTKSETKNVGTSLQKFLDENVELIKNAGGHDKAGAIHFKTDDMDQALDIIEPFIVGF